MQIQTESYETPIERGLLGRVDGELKVSGRMIYAGDVLFPNMLHAAFVRSPYSHARIVNVFTAAAQELPGVHAVLTGKDVAHFRYGRLVRDVPLLAVDKVRFAGERVAVVVAETLSLAERAAALVEVEYDPLPEVFDPEEALRPGAPAIHDAPWNYDGSLVEMGGPPNLQAHYVWTGGSDVEAALAASYHRIEERFKTEANHPGYLEPHVCTAMVDANGRVRLWASNKSPYPEPRIKTMLYLPFNDPEASLDMIDEFGETPGVVGFMVTSVRYRPIWDNSYMKIYRALEERGLPLGFHAAHTVDRSLEQFNRFLSIHSIGFPFSNMVHMTNWIINGMPERFPNLKVLWIEGGLAYLPFLMKRLDHSYSMRTSEAPLLKRKPSGYIRDMYFTTQPLEHSYGSTDWLELTFEMIDAENKLLYASDYPHWDFDLSSAIYDLPFLSHEAKAKILGQNAAKLFNLSDPFANESAGRS